MAGKMKNCSSCGKVFVSINNARICMDCREKEEKWEREIVEATGVQEPVIRRMIREGRFVSTGIELYYPCEKCGSPIDKGQYCEKCQKEMRDELTAAIAKKSSVGGKGDGSANRRGYVTLNDK